MQMYSEAAHLDHFAFSAGDQQGVLTGTRLDEVAGLELDGIHFTPGDLSRADGKDQLKLSASNSAARLHCNRARSWWHMLPSRTDGCWIWTR